jgi:uncharacterized SAM-binding protein YcdF (DUF218 family)
VRRVGLGIVVLGALYGCAVLVEVWSFGRRDERPRSDAIVVMGAAQWDGRPSPVLKARLDHALELYRAGVAPTVVVTGGKLPGDRFTEADVSAGYLVDNGVPQDAVVALADGSTSWQELQLVAVRLRGRTNVARPSVVLVSDPYHQRRIVGMAGELGLQAHSSPRSTRSAQQPWLPVHYAQETAGVAFAHVFGFHNLVWLDPG